MMPSNALRVLVPSLLLPVFMSHAGGWAVVTVDSLPDYVEAGKAVTLSVRTDRSVLVQSG